MCHVREIVIAPAFQDRGIGTALLRTTLERAAEQGAPVRLRTNRANYRAAALYRRLGFQNVGRTPTHLLFEWRGWVPGPLTIGLHPEEPAAGPWRAERIADVVARFGGRTRRITTRPLVVAIDGRSSSGKTTLAARVARVVPATTVVHTDDIAWWHSRFGWADLAEHVLETVRAGEALYFRPPAWIERDREGAIVVPGGIQLLVLEGVGASRDELAHLLDARIWVQTDQAEIDRRNKARGADDGWLEEELPWVAVHRPWEHADLVIAGSPMLSHNPQIEVVVADGPL